MSIHKSQGRTLERVKVDLGKVFRERSGQAIQSAHIIHVTRTSVCSNLAGHLFGRSSSLKLAKGR